MAVTATTHSQPLQPDLPRELPAAHREILGLRRRNARQAEIIAEYREWERWTRQLLALPQGQLAPTAKAVAWAIEDKHRAYRRRYPERAAHELMPVYYGALAERTGVTPSSVCRAVAVLEERGMLRRHSHRDPATQKTHTEVEVLPALHEPAEMIPAEKSRGQGGKRDRPVCRECPPATPVVEQATTTTRWTCAGCGTRLGEATATRERLHGDGGPDAADGSTRSGGPLQSCDGNGDGIGVSRMDVDETAEGGAGASALTEASAVTRAHDRSAEDQPLHRCNGQALPEERARTGGACRAEVGRTARLPSVEHRASEQGQHQASIVRDPGAAPRRDQPLHICNGPAGEEEAGLRRLALIAGDRPRHIALLPSGPHKYAWQRDAQGRDLPITEALLRAHLVGERAIGTELRWGDGGACRTYALCWDADDARAFARLQAAARRLWRSGARPVLERSPSRQHPGGGRLWLWFDRAVDAGAAWATACRHAPYLARVRECWPEWRLGPEGRGQAVRLPCGVYRRDGLCAPIPHAPWRPDGLVWRTGAPARALLLTELTPVAWVTEPPPPPSAGEAPALPMPALPELDTTPIEPDSDHPLPAAFADPAWLAKYGHSRDAMLFAVTAREAIAWCNARHDVRQLLPQEANGYARATWRGERTPSVGYVGTNGWVDHGAGGRRPDGRRDGGDAFEALCRVRGVDRAALLEAEVVPALLAEARATLEGCARAGRPLPGWVAAITTPAGWARYDVCRSASAQRIEE